MSYLPIVILSASACGGLGYAIAQPKGFGITGLFLGFLLGPIGVLIAAVTTKQPNIVAIGFVGGIVLFLAIYLTIQYQEAERIKEIDRQIEKDHKELEERLKRNHEDYEREMKHLEEMKRRLGI